MASAVEYIEVPEVSIDSDHKMLRNILRQDHVESFQRLCDLVGSVNLLIGGKSALAVAVKGRLRRIFDFLVAQPGLTIDRSTQSQRTPLLYAIRGYCTAKMGSRNRAISKHFIETLLKAGANINLLNKDGHGPLAWACFLGSDECISMLLCYGADPKVLSKKGFHPFHAAASSTCSNQVLDTLFRLTYDDREDVSLHLLTITDLIKSRHLMFLHQILPRVSTVQVNSKNSMQRLVNELHKLPFRMFLRIAEKFSNIQEALKKYQNLDFTHLFQASPEAGDYMQYLCPNQQPNLSSTHFI